MHQLHLPTGLAFERSLRMFPHFLFQLSRVACLLECAVLGTTAEYRQLFVLCQYLVFVSSLVGDAPC
jgi:hypothetical protein